jgi:putative ABC transport system permease protein
VLPPIAAAISVAVSLLLLLAYANVAGVLIARSAARRREMALRLVLGARGMRLSGRQLLTKRATLTFAGAAGGLVSASGFSPRSTPASHPTCIESAVLALYSRSIGVAAVVVVIAALALALPTALVTIGADVQAHLRESNHRCISLSMSKRVTLGGCDRAHLRKGLADTVVHGRRRS